MTSRSTRAVVAAALLVLLVGLGVLVRRAAVREQAAVPTPGPSEPELERSEPTVRLEAVGRFRTGRVITAVAFDGERVAVFGSDGTLEVVALSDPEASGLADGPTGDRLPTGPTVDALWTPAGLLSVEAGERPAAVLRTGDELRVAATVPLDGRPVDLDGGVDEVVVLTRTDDGGRVVSLVVAEGSIRYKGHVDVGPAPVGLFRAGDAYAVPSYSGRSVHVVPGGDAAAARVVPVPFRPVAVLPLAGGLLATAGNAPVGALVPGGAAPPTSVELPEPWSTTAAIEGVVVAFSASSGTLYRVTDPNTMVAASDREFGLVTAIAPLSTGRFALADAGEEPRLAILDATTLATLAETPVEGRPAWLSIVGDHIAVTSPAEGVVTMWQVVESQPGAAPN